MPLRFTLCLVCSALISLVSSEQIVLFLQTKTKTKTKTIYLLNILCWILTSFGLVFDLSAMAIFLSEKDAIPIGVICILPRITHFIGSSKILPKEKFGFLNSINLDSEIILQSINKSYLSKTRILEMICLFDITFFKFLPFTEDFPINARGWPSIRAMKIGNITKLFHCIIAAITSTVWLIFSANSAPKEFVIIVSISFTLASGSLLLQMYETYKSYTITNDGTEANNRPVISETKNVMINKA